MARSHVSGVVAILSLLVSAVLCGSDATAANISAGGGKATESQGRQHEETQDTSLWRLVECFSEDVISDCIADRTSRALRSMLGIPGSNGKLKVSGDEDENELEEASSGETSVSTVIGQLVGEGLSRLVPLLQGEDDDDEDETEAEEDEQTEQDNQQVAGDQPENKSGLRGESRKKKKKKLLMKLHNLVQKLFMLKMLIKSKFAMLLMKLSLLMQLKLVLLVLANLLVNVYRLYLEKSHPPEPQKVVYYEHAQHQHHYDQEHFHHGEEDKGWLGHLWSRSVEEQPAAHEVAYSAHRPVYTDSPNINKNIAPRLPYLTPKPLLG